MLKKKRGRNFSRAEFLSVDRPGLTGVRRQLALARHGLVDRNLFGADYLASLVVNTNVKTFGGSSIWPENVPLSGV